MKKNCYDGSLKHTSLLLFCINELERVFGPSGFSGERACFCQYFLLSRPFKVIEGFDANTQRPNCTNFLRDPFFIPFVVRPGADAIEKM